jgi:hypothetical protein
MVTCSNAVAGAYAPALFAASDAPQSNATGSEDA